MKTNILIKIVSLAILLSFLLTAFSGCLPEEQTADFSDVKAICELSTLKCYFHNVAEYKKEASGAGKWFGKIGYNKCWFEYDGTVTYGVDASKVRIEKPDPKTGVVKVYIPPVTVLGTNVEKDSFSKPITELGWFTNISLKEENEALVAAQAEMEKTANTNNSLKNQAFQKAKKTIENYIVKVGKQIGREYTVEWLDK